MRKPITLPELIQEHFDGVLETVDSGRWGDWVLDRERLDRGELALVHERAGVSMSVDAPRDWVALAADLRWATADDVGNLVFAVRDLEYARWLGVLPIH